MFLSQHQRSLSSTELLFGSPVELKLGLLSGDGSKTRTCSPITFAKACLLLLNSVSFSGLSRTTTFKYVNSYSSRFIDALYYVVDPFLFTF